MTPKSIIVLDTNTLLSAAIRLDSISNQALSFSRTM